MRRAFKFFFYVSLLVSSTPLKSWGAVSKASSPEAKCDQGNAEACAALGAGLYDKDKEKGAAFFRRACDLGKESLCIFYDSAHPRPARAVVSSKVAGKSSAESVLIAWVNANVPDFLAALYPVRDIGRPEHFSLDQCRVPDNKLVQLVLKLIPVYRHSFKFGAGCDAEGAIEIRLNNPYDLDLKTRKLGGVARIQGKMKTEVTHVSPTEIQQITTISSANAYDEKGKVFARFELNHHRSIAMDLARQSVSTTDNIGRVHITEFQGQPMNYEQSFALDHLDH